MQKSPVKENRVVVKPKRERLLNWGHLEGDLRLIEEHGGLDSIVPEITTLKGLKRRLALWTSRLVLYLSRVMTKRQTQVNRSVLNSLGNMSHGFDRIEASLVELDKQMVNMKSDILSLEYRLDRLLEKTSGETGHSTADFLEERHHAMDALYLAFENRFRGSREEVKRRLEVYLPCMEEAAKNTESKKVVDLGCGRGEWLELLRESAFEANGVDTNRLQLEECRKRGLPAVEQEVLEHLRALPDASVAAITGFHIAEHLPFLVLIKILDETMRVLKPGGVIVLETPNPENVDVGACSFYLDPTHKNPLVPESLQFLAGQRGFINIDVIRLVQPFREKPLEPLAGTDVLTIKINALVGFLNNRFYSSQDFAVIGRKARVA